VSGEFRAIIRVGLGKAVYRDGLVETAYGVLEAKSVGVEQVLSIVAACFSRSIAEKLGVREVEVELELLEDLDALLDGDLEGSEILRVRVRAGGALRESIEGALAGCPFYALLKAKIKSLEVL